MFNLNYTLAVIAVTSCMLFGSASECLSQNTKLTEVLALRELRSDTDGRVKITTHRSTQKANFVWLDNAAPGSLSKAGDAESPRAKAAEFLRRNGVVFGLAGPGSALIEKGEKVDALGFRHLEYEQYYNGVPVFAGILKIHFNSAGELRAANGTLVPAINLNTTPTKSSDEAAAVAIAKISREKPSAGILRAIEKKLYVYRSGLIEGAYGENHLAWRIKLSNGSTIYESVFVDAHSGEVAAKFSERRAALDRRVYDGLGAPIYPPLSYPDNPFWLEGQLFPTGNVEADNVLLGSKETYNLFRSAFGRDSYDDNGSPMISIINLPINAFQTDYPVVLTAYGPGWTDDDVVGHEWTHAYTSFTHNLIYFAQPGALNESYSDIFGETVDRLNGRGLDTPGGRRDVNCRYCSTLTPALPILKVNSPSSIAGTYEANRVVFGPAVPAAGISSEIVLVDDGIGDAPSTPFVPTRADACETPFVNADEVKGKIALIDPTSFFFSPCDTNTQVKNAQANGAVGVVIATYAGEGDVLIPYFFTDDPGITIPSIVIGNSADRLIRSQLASGVNILMTYDHAGIKDETYRWLQHEEGGIFGATSDMWRPACRRMPGKTSDKNYYCGFSDNAGVHWNSSVPNLTFALLADGGTYNNRTVNAIGLTKALHIYYRAMSVYQVPLTDFADHANAIEAAAADLVGRNLPDLVTGAPSGERIDGNDLQAIHAATLATELRDYPANCRPLIGKNPPPDACTELGTKQKTLFADTFEGNPIPRWQVGREDQNPATFIPRDWRWVHSLPDNRSGSGMFAVDPLDSCTSPFPGQAGVLTLTSPSIKVPDSVLGGPHASFDHYVNTEFGFDGAQVMVSVNGGPFRLVPRENFIYSPYNFRLFGPFTPPNSPREDQWAFTGADPIPFDGSWGTSIVDLSNFAHAGDIVRLRFDLSTDYCLGTDSGWYVDNVRVYACVPRE